MIHNQVYPVFVALVAQSVVFHVDSISHFDNLSNYHFWLKPGTLSSTAAEAAWLSRGLKPYFVNDGNIAITHPAET
jgi:hypothetical protein